MLLPPVEVFASSLRWSHPVPSLFGTLRTPDAVRTSDPISVACNETDLGQDLNNLSSSILCILHSIHPSVAVHPRAGDTDTNTLNGRLHVTDTLVHSLYIIFRRGLSRNMASVYNIGHKRIKSVYGCVNLCSQ